MWGGAWVPISSAHACPPASASRAAEMQEAACRGQRPPRSPHWLPLLSSPYPTTFLHSLISGSLVFAPPALLRCSDFSQDRLLLLGEAGSRRGWVCRVMVLLSLQASWPPGCPSLSRHSVRPSVWGALRAMERAAVYLAAPWEVGERPHRAAPNPQCGLQA